MLSITKCALCKIQIKFFYSLTWHIDVLFVFHTQDQTHLKPDNNNSILHQGYATMEALKLKNNQLAQLLRTSLSVKEVRGSTAELVKSTQCRHRYEVSSELCCLGAKPRR